MTQIPEAAVEAAAATYHEARAGLNVWEDLVPVERLFWLGMMRPALEAAAPHMLSHEREQTRLAHLDAVVNAQSVDGLERELADAQRVIALLVLEAGGKVTISRRAASELSMDAVVETTQDVVNGGWVIRAKQ